MDVSTLPGECKDGCIYTKMGLGNIFDADVGDVIFDEGERGVSAFDFSLNLPIFDCTPNL